MNRIKNYEELIAERRRVELQIVSQRLILKEGLQEVKEKFEPFLYLLPVLNIFKKTERSHSLMNAAAAVGIDVLVGQKLLSKAGWLARLLVPMVLKGVASFAMKNKKASINQD